MSGLFCIGSMFCDVVSVAHSSLAIIFLGMVEVLLYINYVVTVFVMCLLLMVL